MENNRAATTNEQIVAMHLNARKKRKRKLIITMVVIIVALLIIITVGVVWAKKSISSAFGSSGSSEVESAQVTSGSISTTVSGTGTLASEDVDEIEILSSLEIDDYYVDEGDSVEEGDLIATVTSASLLSAMSDKQDELDEIDAELEEAADDEVSDTITAGASGRVKLVNVSSGDDVAGVMYSAGSLMLLSLDGYMAVDISSDSLKAGDSVTVTLSDGTEKSGTVEKNVDGTATILVTDNGTDYGDEVTVTDSDGNESGTGELYIHSQIIVTGYAGTVSSVSVSENESVSAGDTLITLTDTETSVGYDSLLKEREEIEEQLDDLISIYKNGGICATISGVIETLDSGSSSSSSVSSTDSVSEQSAKTSSGDSYTTVATISPDTQMSITISVDETDILSLIEGQEAVVTIDSVGEDEFAGSVTEISTSASSDSGVTSYSAVVTIDKTDDMLAGMSATVVITIEGVDDALLIPVDALHQTSSTSYVYTEYDESSGEFSGMVEVTTGLSNSNYVEITSGLSEGDIVYYSASEEDSSFNFGGMDFDAGGGNDMNGGMDLNSEGGGMSMPSGGAGGGEMPGN